MSNDFLSKNFRLSEFISSADLKVLDPALRETIKKRIQINLVEKIFQPMRDDLNLIIRIISGYRNPEHNADVGGMPNSYRLYNQDKSAADFTTENMQEAWNWLRQNHSNFCYSYWNKIKNFIHVSGLTNYDRRVGIMWTDDENGRHWEPDTSGKEINL